MARKANRSERRADARSRGPARASIANSPDPESLRLAEDGRREKNWKRFGPYLAERQWGTVREDYSESGDCWRYFPHDHARSRAYRWGEDGLLGITDRECRLCFGLALWNGKDPILKERLFGLANHEGNHGEDAKELWWYLDSTPTHSWLRSLYKYPQAEFPYERLVAGNAARGPGERELEIEETGAFDGGRYFDVFAEYAKAAPDDILIRITIVNRGPESAPLHVLPTLWFRNVWSWGCEHEGCGTKPVLRDRSAHGATTISSLHPTLGAFHLHVRGVDDGTRGAKVSPPRELLFTENETNHDRLHDAPQLQPYVKDAFHRRVIQGEVAAVNPARHGTKAAAWFALDVPAGATRRIELRLVASAPGAAPMEKPFGRSYDVAFAARRRESDAYWESRLPKRASADAKLVARQAYAGLLHSKQFYHYVVKHWLDGDPSQPTPPTARRTGRNHSWSHLFNRDVISMPDKWEYPWYAAWDLAFHMLPLARVDPAFAKEQLVLFLREWYMHPNGQLPAYEFELSDVNPPVHAWAAWRVYKASAPAGQRDRVFLERVFQKLLLNFTWWVNRKDASGRNIFGGGFLGLDNIGVFDRSKPLPTGGELEQADGTAWMAFYSTTMLSMALELAKGNAAYEDLASKFFEHFVAIVDAMNAMGGGGLWDEDDGFYYDQLRVDGRASPLRVRSMVGLIPLFAVEVLRDDELDRLPGFRKRMEWFLENRKDLARHVAFAERCDPRRGGERLRLLAIPSRDRLVRVLQRMLDEGEFLSPHGVRSLSKAHGEQPFVLRFGEQEFRVDYAPGESKSGLFGGNSNWRGPVWFPVNYLLIEALERYHHFYGDELKLECPTGSGRLLTLREVARELSRRLASLFLADGDGRRPCLGAQPLQTVDPAFRDLVHFHEYFDGETGRGLGASHQTGWTSLVVRCLEDLAT